MDDDVAIPDEVRTAISDVEVAVRSHLRSSGQGAADGLAGLLSDLARRINETEGED